MKYKKMMDSTLKGRIGENLEIVQFKFVVTNDRVLSIFLLFDRFL